MTPGGTPPVVALAALGEELRLLLFELVRSSHQAVSREQAAARLGISRKLAAFHLDKLVEVGLLQAHYRAPGGGGRRVGRAPKVYAAAETAAGGRQDSPAHQLPDWLARNRSRRTNF